VIVVFIRFARFLPIALLNCHQNSHQVSRSCPTPSSRQRRSWGTAWPVLLPIACLTRPLAGFADPMASAAFSLPAMNAVRAQLFTVEGTARHRLARMMPEWLALKGLDRLHAGLDRTGHAGGDLFPGFHTPIPSTGPLLHKIVNSGELCVGIGHCVALRLREQPAAINDRRIEFLQREAARIRLDCDPSRGRSKARRCARGWPGAIDVDDLPPDRPHARSLGGGSVARSPAG